MVLISHITVFTPMSVISNDSIHVRQANSAVRFKSHVYEEMYVKKVEILDVKAVGRSGPLGHIDRMPDNNSMTEFIIEFVIMISEILMSDGTGNKMLSYTSLRLA